MNRESRLNVFVTNTGTGGLGISMALYKEGEDEKSPEIEFNNRYANPAAVRFLARKLLDGEVPTDGRFTFILSDAAGNPLQVKKNQADELVFDEILLRTIGTMTYYIRESVGSNRLITYDPAVFKLTVQVTKNDQGDYQAVTRIEKDNISFTGTPIFNNKTVEGELPNTGEAQTALPIIEAIVLLGGLALSFNRKKT